VKKNRKSLESRIFWINKRLFDIITSLLLLPLLVVFSCIIFILNFFFNKGKLIFFQERMGKDCKSFITYKFRTMTPSEKMTRQYNDPIETDRITQFGKMMRKCRIDELPQIINVLKGDMSLIGPRPDYYDHALVFLNTVEGYRERHDILPGITGLSQTRLGYAEGLDATLKKTNIDNYYIKNLGYCVELRIIFFTIIIICKGLGK